MGGGSRSLARRKSDKAINVNAGEKRKSWANWGGTGTARNLEEKGGRPGRRLENFMRGEKSTANKTCAIKG